MVKRNKLILKIIIPIVCVAGVLLIMAPSIMVLYMMHIGAWRYNIDFKACQDECEYVKDYVLSRFEGSEKKTLCVHSEDSDDGHMVYYLYDLDEQVRYEDEQLSDALSVLYEAFKTDGSIHLDSIDVWEDQTRFSINVGVYQLAYLPDGKPKWILYPSNDVKVEYQSLGNGWYHVIDSPWSE